MSFGKYCMVKTCRKNKKDFPKLSFFTLPKKMEIALKWIKFSGREGIDLQKEYTMCSEHFSENQLKTVHPRKLLYPGSIPCIKGPQAMESDIKNDASNTDGSTFMNGPCAMETEIESVTANTDYIPSCSTVSKRNSSKSVAKSSLSDRKIKRLNKTVNSLRCKMYRKKVIHCFCQSNPPISSNKVTINKLIDESKNYLSKEAHILFANELRASFVKKYNRRYDDSLREMCLLWYYASPKGYRAISKSLNLPTPRTLKNWQSKLKLSPGISPAMVESLKLHFSKNAEQKKEICSLMFDEIALSEELHFDQSNGKIVGVVDTGKIRRNDRATTALVCMARGVAYNWKYVLGYWFLGHTATNEFLYSIILDSIDAAQRSGLKVKAIICDQSPVNQSVAKKLQISTELCFFFRNEEKIYFIYDVPHLLKSIRNNLAKYDLDYSGKPVSWNYVKQVCTSTNSLRVRLLPKITKEHLKVSTFNAMRVKYAAQILSESVSVAMDVLMQLGQLPAESMFTSQFISDMDKAFDCLNSSKLEEDKLKMRYALSENSPHRDFLIKIRDNLGNSKFLSKRSVPPCINGFIITINSILQLADDLRNICDIPKLLTRHLNQDPLENFFATVRQQHGCCQNPSPKQFENGLRHNYITSITKLCSNSNCEEDFTFSLEKLKKLSHITVYENKGENTILELKDIEDVQIDLEEKNAVFYVSGYMARKFLKLHPCEICSNILLDKQKLLTGQHQVFTYFKQGESIDTEKGLLYASHELFKYIENLEIIHNTYFNELLYSKQIVVELIDIVKFKHNIEFALCSTESSDKFLQLFMTIRCHWGVRFINQSKNKKVTTKNQKLKNICHE